MKKMQDDLRDLTTKLEEAKRETEGIKQSLAREQQALEQLNVSLCIEKYMYKFTNEFCTVRMYVVRYVCIVAPSFIQNKCDCFIRIF